MENSDLALSLKVDKWETTFPGLLLLDLSPFFQVLLLSNYLDERDSLLWVIIKSGERL